MNTSRFNEVYTKQQQIAEIAKRNPQMRLTTLNHYLDIDWMREAHQRTRKDATPGNDGVVSLQYEKELEKNLRGLIDRAKSGSYWAPPVKRVYIPKADGKQRAIGIPTHEDKVLQRAVAMVLEPVYEQEFHQCSYGFRPGRSAHQAIQQLWEEIMKIGGCWLLDADIKSFFDTMEHPHLRQFVSKRMGDGVIKRLLGKWLKAGVIEEGKLMYQQAGSPQGGVISPLLSNIYLHEVLDDWFEKQVKIRLKGRTFMIRYADDFVMGFQYQTDARKVLEVLIKRFAKYGLAINTEKTRVVDFYPGKNETFDFAGFTHYWAQSRRGKPIIKRKTGKDRLNRALKKIGQWCKKNRHSPITEQHRELNLKIRGHYSYYGITNNGRALSSFLYGATRLWQKWLNRRSRKRSHDWNWMNQFLLKHYPLPPVQIVHSIYHANP